MFLAATAQLPGPSDSNGMNWSNLARDMSETAADPEYSRLDCKGKQRL